MYQGLLVEGEEIITESSNKLVTLTNYRIRYHNSSWGQAHLISIMLDKVSSVEVRYKSWWLLLVPSLILLVGGMLAGVQGIEEAMVIGIGSGLLLALIYVFSRRHVITISSDAGTSINFQTKGMNKDKVLEFVNKVERARKHYKLN
jgi:hypothetical protein